MAISIYDKSNCQYIIGDMISDFHINQPLVTERREKFSFPFGDAELVQIAFSGIFIIFGDMIVKESQLRVKSLEEPETVELHFSLQGSRTLDNYVTNKKFSIKANHHNIRYSPNFDGVADFSSNLQNKFFEVHFQRERFVDLTSESSSLLRVFADNIMNNIHVELFEENLPISLAMHSCINEIMNCKFTGGLKLLYLQSKCVELLALQAQAFEIAAKKTESSKLKSDYDKDRIYYAREYLLNHSNQPPSLPELAKIAGINEFKLKQGFKEIFKNTVFGYLSDYKLMKAKELLADRQMDIKCIADELGYSSVQHFSTAFNKKFGISPGKAR